MGSNDNPFIKAFLINGWRFVTFTAPMNRNYIRILTILKEDLRGQETVAVDSPKGLWTKVHMNFKESLRFLSLGVKRQNNPYLLDLEKGLIELTELFKLLRQEKFEFQLNEGAYDLKVALSAKIIQLGYVRFPEGIKGLQKDLLKYHRLVRDYDRRLEKIKAIQEGTLEA